MDALQKFMGRSLSMKPFLRALNAPMEKQKEFRERVWGVLRAGSEIAGVFGRFVLRCFSSRGLGAFREGLLADVRSPRKSFDSRPAGKRRRR